MEATPPNTSENELSPKVARVLTLTQCGEEFGVHPNTIKKWIDRGCPHDPAVGNKPHRLDAAEVAAWKRENGITGKVGRPSGAGGDSLDAARCRKENAMADWHEIRVARERSNLLPADEVKTQWLTHISAAKSVLLGIPAAVAPQCVGLEAGEIQSILDAHVREALTRLSEGNERDMDEPESGGDGDVASAGPNAPLGVGGTIPHLTGEN